MSIGAVDWVLKHSEATLGRRLVLIALADTAQDDGTRTFPAVETIARKARLTRRAAQTALRRLEAEGHIAATGKTRGGTTVYRLIGLPGGEDSTRVVDDAGGVVDDAGGVVRDAASGVVSSPEPLTVRQPLGNKNGSEPIGFEDWLEHHCELTGQSVPRLSKARAELARKYGELSGEGRSADDMKLASVGAHADQWRRENGKDYPRNVLVFATIDELIDKGRKAAKQTGGGAKRFVRKGPRRDI